MNIDSFDLIIKCSTKCGTYWYFVGNPSFHLNTLYRRLRRDVRKHTSDCRARILRTRLNNETGQTTQAVVYKWSLGQPLPVIKLKKE